MKTFGELLTEYMKRTGISDSDLARSIGVQRQTIFRWKEGATSRPRVREDVLRCAVRLRLTPDERDLLLLAAGFAPESAPAATMEPVAFPADILVDTQVGTEVSSVEPESEPQPVIVVQQAAMYGQFQPAAEIAPSPAGLPARQTKRHFLRWGPIGLIGAASVLLLVIVALLDRTPPPPVQPTPVMLTLAAPSASTAAAQHIPVAIGDEMLLIVAPFSNYTQGEGYNVAGRIRSALQNALLDAGLPNAMVEIWPQPLGNQRQAALALARSEGKLIVWGEFDSGRVQANILVTGDDAPTVWERQLGSPDDLPQIINVDTPREITTLAQSALGRLFTSKQEYAQAQQAFDRAIALQPVDITTLANLHFYSGLAFERLTPPDWTKAINAYSQTLSLQPQWIYPLYNRGRAHLMRSRLAPLHSQASATDLEQAIVDLSATIIARPAYWEAYLNRGSALFDRNRAGDLDAALADYDKAVEMAADQLVPHLARGLALIRAGDTAGWQRDLARSLELAPQSPTVHQTLCWGYVAIFQPDDALRHCEQAQSLTAEPDAYRDLSGLAFAQKNDLDRAQEELAAYLAWVKTQPAQLYERLNGDKIERLLAELTAGSNPVTEQLIDELRKGD
jgi:tetratricopeptide (TPR) repeat protein/transcriptional regulator with XRE-family HTH domain